MQRLLAAIDALNEWSGRIFSLALLVATVLVVVEVVLRYGFNAPTVWGLELIIYLCAATYAVGGGYAHLHDAHVRVDLLYARWSPRTRAAVDVFVSAPIFFLGVGVLLWTGWAWTLEAAAEGTTSGSLWNPPVWPIRLLIPLGSLLLLLQGLARLLRDLQTVRDGGPPP